MALINSLLSWLIKKRIHQIQLFMKYPHEVQSEWFKKLVQSAKNTEWGKQYDYASVGAKCKGLHPPADGTCRSKKPNRQQQ